MLESAIPYRKPYNPEDHRKTLANAIVKLYNQNIIRKGTGLHALAVRVHHALVGDHDLLTDLQIHLRIYLELPDDGSKDAEIAKRILPLAGLAPDFYRLVAWLDKKVNHG